MYKKILIITLSLGLLLRTCSSDTIDFYKKGTCTAWSSHLPCMKECALRGYAYGYCKNKFLYIINWCVCSQVPFSGEYVNG
uniref:Toxin n=1 Tax=Strongyloides venezuelensis TaxID=75913 RepID=A0A0K0EW12_STRVS